MREIDVLNEPGIIRYGRIPQSGNAFPLYWNTAGLEIQVKGTCLEAEISSHWKTMKPYISFEVDGLRAQTFAPLQGTYKYNVFQSLDPKKIHRVRIIKETQPFEADPDGTPVINRLFVDGTLSEIQGKKMRLEFIGDSITSAEGLRGPAAFMEWIPMVFGASDSYPRLAAEALDADFHVISQSGWGICCSWDHVESHKLLNIYDKVCALQEGGDIPQDTGWSPEHIFIALGANDQNAMDHPENAVPQSGSTFLLKDDSEGRERVYSDALALISHLHAVYPNAELHWLLFDSTGTVADMIREAAKKAVEKRIPITLSVPLDPDTEYPSGSRDHPGNTFHQAVARHIIEMLR